MKEMFMSFFRGFWDGFKPDRDLVEDYGWVVGVILFIVILSVVAASLFKLFLTLFA